MLMTEWKSIAKSYRSFKADVLDKASWDAFLTGELSLTICGLYRVSTCCISLEDFLELCLEALITGAGGDVLGGSLDTFLTTFIGGSGGGT